MIKLMNLEYIQDPRSIEDVFDEVIIGSAEPPLLPRHIHCCNYLFPHRQNFFFFLFFFTSPHFFLRGEETRKAGIFGNIRDSLSCENSTVSANCCMFFSS
jgi:hypothetical protein